MELTSEQKQNMAAFETQRACELAAGGHHKCGLIPESFGTPPERKHPSASTTKQ